MSKIKLYLDFDNTLTNSTKSFCKTYNLFYNFIPNFVLANYEKVDAWNFRDQCTLIKTDEEVEKIFGMQTFFANLEFMNKNTKEILQELNEKYHIILCSVGSYQNISLKSDWIQRNLSFIKDSIFIVNGGNYKDSFNKSIIDMSNSIIVDDVEDNLYSSNAKYKINFGDIHSWNCNWNGVRCTTWDDVKDYLESMK